VVFNDLNHNTYLDAGEPGIGGITVTLSGAASLITETNGYGAYSFWSLNPGNYTVGISPSGYVLTTSNNIFVPLGFDETAIVHFGISPAAIDIEKTTNGIDA
ncbi:MAG: hypothetical protein GWN67_27420, partial [Phycisphaerae bacterium]|nr:hypothetical protein [Gammaproteobacteria bacterium]NIR96277.1 hypothetical protein [Gammaproteobacteria bacterium]NIU59954.1 hypothetical protein [Phycisphaerae bacterium]NIW96296.1 hypothetical protein [Phycisphaerae bacterium]